MNMYGTLAGARGPFTPSQWMELEHQAMIYKCIDANVPIPPSLLFFIRKSLNPSGYSPYSAGSLRPGAFSAVGWGSFQLGFSSSTDPEPGRCRRTDGKKWRCSRDAVADQKYCERHLNRGRHRSRKPVEGHNGQAKAMPIIAPSSASAVSGGGSSNCCTIAQHQIKSLQPVSTDRISTQLNRIPVDKDNVNDPQSLSLPTTVNPELKDTGFPIMGLHNSFEDPSSRTDFGLNCTNSVLHPSSNSYMENRRFAASTDLKDHSHPFRHFIDEWPKNQSDHSNIAWPGVEEDPTDRTQLSISSLEFSSSSPAQEKLNYSPRKPSRELDPIHMGLGLGGVPNDVNQRQASWVPISWETSMGGPLGEVLNSTCKDSIKNTSALNLLTSGWDSSPPPESSPTGVLQKAALCSLSSSTGSSPRVNYKSHESAGSLCDDLLGSTLLKSASISTL